MDYMSAMFVRGFYVVATIRGHGETPSSFAAVCSFPVAAELFSLFRVVGQTSYFVRPLPKSKKVKQAFTTFVCIFVASWILPQCHKRAFFNSFCLSNLHVWSWMAPIVGCRASLGGSTFVQTVTQHNHSQLFRTPTKNALLVSPFRNCSAKHGVARMLWPYDDLFWVSALARK